MECDHARGLKEKHTCLDFLYFNRFFPFPG